jgi:hypothetical protein
MHGSKFENLQIRGKPVTMNLDFALFERIQTFKQAHDAYADTESPFYAAASDPFQTGTPLPHCANSTLKLPLTKPRIQNGPLGSVWSRRGF